MTEKEYYDAIRALVPSYGEMPLSYKQELVDRLKKNGKTKFEPASDKELQAVIGYLNATCMETDLMCGNLGFGRYKDAVLCINYEHTGWILLERRPDEQMWDLWNYMINLEFDEILSKDMSNIYSIK